MFKNTALQMWLESFPLLVETEEMFLKLFQYASQKHISQNQLSSSALDQKERRVISHQKFSHTVVRVCASVPVSIYNDITV